MCSPALVTLALTVVTTATSIHQQNQAADQAADALEDQASVNRAALEDRSKEVTEDANLARFERKKQLQREIATTRVAQSEGGVLYGNTALRTMASGLISGGQDIALIEKQEERIQHQIGRQQEAVSAGAALLMAGLKWTSPLMAGLQTASAGYGAYVGAGGSSSSF